MEAEEGGDAEDEQKKEEERKEEEEKNERELVEEKGNKEEDVRVEKMEEEEKEELKEEEKDALSGDNQLLFRIIYNSINGEIARGQPFCWLTHLLKKFGFFEKLRFAIIHQAFTVQLIVGIILSLVYF